MRYNVHSGGYDEPIGRVAFDGIREQVRSLAEQIGLKMEECPGSGKTFMFIRWGKVILRWSPATGKWYGR